ncbi:MAG: hypothetical protein IPH82_19680 [Chloroflexi bacterium]|nr:hypothetical protein [Chloroflexota bacterium]
MAEDGTTVRVNQILSNKPGEDLVTIIFLLGFGLISDFYARWLHNCGPNTNGRR